MYRDDAKIHTKGLARFGGVSAASYYGGGLEIARWGGVDAATPLIMIAFLHVQCFERLLDYTTPRTLWPAPQVQYAASSFCLALLILSPCPVNILLCISPMCGIGTNEQHEVFQTPL